MLDVNSGQIHLVDDLFYDIIIYELHKEAIVSKLIKKYNDSQYDYLFIEDEQAILSAIEDVEELYQEVLLQDIYEEYIQDFKSGKTVVSCVTYCPRL